MYGSEEASVRTSKTYEVQDGGEVELQYGQVADGVEVDGVTVSSDEVLHHELIHARDYVTNEVTNEDPSLLRKYGEQKGRMEARAVLETNDYRQAKNPVAPLRTHYKAHKL